MIKGKLNNCKSISVSSEYLYHKEDETEIYIVGHIYNLFAKNIAEVVLKSYLNEGYRYFSRVDGSFVIIIYTTKQTIIVRDHHGLGAQIYYEKNMFSSSLYDLTREDNVDATPNYNSLAFFLTAGHVKGPNSSFSNIFKLDAGHILEYEEGKQLKTINLFPSDEVIPQIDKRKTLDDYADEFYSLHKQAIERRINNQNKVGLFLSGGYDSGANLIALREIYNKDIFTYSIGFKGSNISELPQSKLMTQTFDSIHQEYEIDGSEISALPKLIKHFGDPFAECGMMVNYSVFGLSGFNFDGVLLGGEGNDHYFSTANRQMAINCLIAKSGLTKPLNALKSYLNQEKFDNDGLLYRPNFHLETSLNIIQGEIFGFPRWQVPRFLNEKSHLLPNPFIVPKNNKYEELYLQHVLLTDIEKSLNRIILFKSSKISQIYNSHIAYPFVDLDIYHFMNNLPTEYKCKGKNLFSIAMGKGISKYLHKYIYSPKMPKIVAEKPKQGGFVPMAIFFQDDNQRKRLSEFILSSSICDDFLNKKEVEKFLQLFDKESKDPIKWFWYRQIKCNQFFNILSLAIWWEEFVKGKTIQL